MKNQQKRVRFADFHTVHVVAHEADENDAALSSSWIGSHDCMWEKVEFEAEAVKLKGYGILLRDTFDDSLGKDTQSNINAFVQLSGNDCCRGLEMYMSEHHSDERDCAQYKVIHAVLNCQRKLKKKGSSMLEIDDALRSVSEKRSRQSRRFARRIAIADEMVARFDKVPTTARTIVKRLSLNNAKTVSRKNSLTDMQVLPSKVSKQEASNVIQNALDILDDSHSETLPIACITSLTPRTA